MTYLSLFPNPVWVKNAGFGVILSVFESMLYI